MDNNRNFYISAIVAFSSYFLLLILFFIYVSTSDVKKFDALSKDTILELEVIVQKKIKKETKQLKVQKARKDTKISKKIVKKSKSVSAKQRSDLKGLFAKVMTQSRVVKKEKISNVKKSSITSRFKSKFEKQRQTTNNTLSKLLENKKTKVVEKRAGDAKHEDDPYISKIYDILFKRWQPLLIIDGLSAKVILTIYKNGQFNYRIIQYSGDTPFDDQLELFLEKQKLEYFPPPKKSKIDIEVTFTAKGS